MLSIKWCIRAQWRASRRWPKRASRSYTSSSYSIPSPNAVSGADVASARTYCSDLLLYAVRTPDKHVTRVMSHLSGNMILLPTRSRHSFRRKPEMPTLPSAHSTSISLGSPIPCPIPPSVPCGCNSGGTISTRPLPARRRNNRLLCSLRMRSRNWSTGLAAKQG